MKPIFYDFAPKLYQILKIILPLLTVILRLRLHNVRHLRPPITELSSDPLLLLHSLPLQNTKIAVNFMLQATRLRHDLQNSALINQNHHTS